MCCRQVHQLSANTPDGRRNGIWWQPKSRASIRRIAIVPELEVILSRLRETNRRNLWVFETKRGTQLHESNPTERLGEICKELGLKGYVLHSLRKYWASTVAQQGMDWRVMLKMFGHSDFELILSTYYAQNDDPRMIAEASKIDYGLPLSQSVDVANGDSFRYMRIPPEPTTTRSDFEKMSAMEGSSANDALSQSRRIAKMRFNPSCSTAGRDAGRVCSSAAMEFAAKTATNITAEAAGFAPMSLSGMLGQVHIHPCPDHHRSGRNLEVTV